MAKKRAENGDGARRDEGLHEAFMPSPKVDDLQIETLSGDIRDMLLTHVRSIKIPWAMLAEDEQRDTIEAISNGSADLVRRVVAMVSAAKFPVLLVAVGAHKVDKGVEIKLSASPTIENITRLAEHGQGAGVLVLAEASDYFGERAPAKPDKNQPDLPLEHAD